MDVLLLTHRLPYSPNRGDRVRAFHLLHALAARANVDLVSLVHDRAEEDHARDLRQVARTVVTARVPRARNLLRAAAALGRPTPLTHVLLDGRGVESAIDRLVTRHRPDVVIAYCSSMARFALGPSLRGRPLIVDLVDVDSQKWADLATTARWPRRWLYAREARQLARFERIAAEHASATLVVNEREARLAAEVAPSAAIHVVPNGVDVARLRPTPGMLRQPRVVFCGVMSYEPNAQAALWFLREVWPTVRGNRPDATLVFLGSDPPASLRRACADDPRVTVTGAVPDVREHLWSASVSVAPLWIARGVQNKVLEAAAAGLPSVVTPVVFDGLPSQVRPVCAVAGTGAEFAAEVLRLLRYSTGERHQFMQRAALASLEWRAQLEPLWPLLERAARGKTDAASTAPRRNPAGATARVLPWAPHSVKPS